LRKVLCKGLVLFAGFMAMPGKTYPDQHFVTPGSYKFDERFSHLQSFLEVKYNPIYHLTPDFLVAADRYDLDWRLLPAIAIIESSGGKHYKNNNIFGWDSCNMRFDTLRDGIHHVAQRFAESKLYKDKDIDGILGTYNPYKSYPRRVKDVMRAMGPAHPAAADLN